MQIAVSSSCRASGESSGERRCVKNENGRQIKCVAAAADADRAYDSAMRDTDHAPVIAIAMMAARADGRVDSVEQQAVDAAVARAGNPDVTSLAQQVAAGQLRVA